MQISLFGQKEQVKIKKPIRLIELFAGYGSQHLALNYLGTNCESWKICEWAVKSIQAYKDMHFTNDNTDYSKELSKEEIINYLANRGISADYNKPMTQDQIKRLGEQKQRQIYNNICATHNLVNIQQTHAKDLCIEDTDTYDYIMTYSFPCQDLSNAGLGKGMEKGSGTRSGLLWEVERILNECNGNLPQVLLMENVPQVHGKKNIEVFNNWLQSLEKLGYKNYWQDLNAKDFGIPQNRNRCFMVSVLNNKSFEFPSKQELKLKLKDVLEENVDEKYYLSDKLISYVLDVNDVALNSERNINERIINPNIAKTISCRGATEQRADVTNFVIDNIENEIKVKELKAFKPNLKTQLCNQLVAIKENTNIRNVMDDCATTLGTNCGSSTSSGGGVVYNDLRIRKLTPKECFRLMGVRDEDFENVAKNQSNASLYHLAGDSIVVNVLMAIFREML